MQMDVSPVFLPGTFKRLKMDLIDIKGTDGKYKASEEGKVYSFIRGRLRELKGSANSWGYYTLCVFLSNGKKRGTTVHRLIAETFIPNPFKYEQVNHINGDKSDNRAVNLEWVSCLTNVEHAIKNGLRKAFPDQTKNKILQYKNNELIRIYDSMSALKAKGFTPCNIRNAIKGNISHAYGYQWKYAE
jgi:hypothetical protein